MNWTYAAIMLAAWATAFGLLLLRRQPLGVDRRGLAAIALGAFCGGMIGAKLPFVLADWPGFLSGRAWFDDGKTIVSGLLGGYFGAMVTEWRWASRAWPAMCWPLRWQRASASDGWLAFTPAAVTALPLRCPGA